MQTDEDMEGAIAPIKNPTYLAHTIFDFFR